jgi:hypothetical protein
LESLPSSLPHRRAAAMCSASAHLLPLGEPPRRVLSVPFSCVGAILPPPPHTGPFRSCHRPSRRVPSLEHISAPVSLRPLRRHSALLRVGPCDLAGPPRLGLWSLSKISNSSARRRHPPLATPCAAPPPPPQVRSVRARAPNLAPISGRPSGR